MTGRELRSALLAAEAEARAAKTVLDELRAGHPANALELLEQTLDANILAIHSLGEKLGSAERERAAVTLRVLQEYRQRHPRKAEAKIEGTDEAALRNLQGRVREILHGTK